MDDSDAVPSQVMSKRPDSFQVGQRVMIAWLHLFVTGRDETVSVKKPAQVISALRAIQEIFKSAVSRSFSEAEGRLLGASYV
jgi:hypothetical protein